MSWWPFGSKEEPPEKLPSVSENTLADIARGIQHAVNSTVRLIEQHYSTLFARYFDEDGKAITKQIKLPDGEHVLDVALIALIPPSGLALAEMDVDLAVRIDNSVLKKAAPKSVPTEITRTSFEVSVCPRSGDRSPQKEATKGSAIDIRMKFVAGDPPEGVARVMDYFTNALVPKAIDTGQPQASTDPDNAPDSTIDNKE